MSKQPPAELAAEQEEEIWQWASKLRVDALEACSWGDYATIAHLHRKLAGVMREYQKFKKKQEALQHMINETKKEEASE